MPRAKGSRIRVTPHRQTCASTTTTVRRRTYVGRGSRCACIGDEKVPDLHERVGNVFDSAQPARREALLV